MAASPGPALFDVRTLAGYTPLDVAWHVKPAVGSTSPPRSAGAGATLAKKAAAPASPRAADGSEDTSWVRTDEDVFAYFERHGPEAQMQYFFLLPSVEAVPTSRRAGPWGASAPNSAASEFFLRVVPPEKITHVPLYFIISPRQVVRVDASRGGGAASTRQTETLPVEEWRGLKKAFQTLRRLTFFSCFSLAKCFARWRRTARGLVLLRRHRALASELLPACGTFGQALLGAQDALEGRLQAVRAVAVQPGRRYTLEEWVEQQAAYRMRKVQPELDEALAALVRTAEAAVQAVEERAAEFERTVQPAELADRIGVDLHAATTKARVRSMQQIKQDKIARAAAYHRSLAERTQLPRFLRLLDLRLRSALADMAAASVATATSALHAAAPGLPGPGHHAGDATTSHACVSSDTEVPASSRSGGSTSRRRGGAPFFCSVDLTVDGGIDFRPNEAEWREAVEAEVVGSSLRLAGSVQALLSLPAFERYQVLLEDQDWWHQPGHQPGQQAGHQPGQQAGEQLGAADLTQQHAVFVAAAAELRSLLSCSFSAARHLAQQYQKLHDIRRFSEEFDFDDWAARQREALDLPATDELLRRLRGWQQQLEGMPLSGTAGLLHVDAAELQAQLAPVVASAQERVTALLLQLAGERCREALSELTVWREVACARPPELEGFLPWSGELAAMQASLQGRLAAAAAVDAALELVVVHAGRLPTADAVKKDDLLEAREQLPAELAAAAAWQAEQCGAHYGAVQEQVAVLGEEAILLESEVQVGQFVDPGAPLGEVLADVELLGARVAQMAAQAEELGAVQAALGMAADPFLEVQEAEAAAKRCTALWNLVCDAEELQAQLSEQAGPVAEDGAAAVSALQERLAALRGAADAPDGIWLRASTALYACRAALGE